MLYTLIVGGLAGWIASTFMKGIGMGIVMNIILGIVGAFVGRFLFSTLGISLGAIGSGAILTDIISATCGAVVVLFIAKIFIK